MSRMFRRVLSKQRCSGAHLFAGCSLPAVRCRNQKKHITVSLCSKMPSLQCSKRMISDFGIRIKCTERKGSIVLYIKESETLSDFLALAGASDAVMVLNEQRIVRQLNNTVNRGVNCINANIEKATRTAMKQAEDIRLVLSVVGAENLPPPLRIVAEARLNNFEMPLSELAEEIGIGRSAANYRLRKLCEMAEDIRTEMPD